MRAGRTAAFLAIAFGGVRGLGLDPNTPSLASLGVFIVASVAASLISYMGSPELGKALFAYGLAARIPVAIVMLVAMLGNWGTHYDVAPPGFPEMGLLSKWLTIGLVPQLTVWIAFTLVLGGLFGGLALAVMRRKPAVQAA